MANSDLSLNRRKFLAGSGAGLGLLASGCRPKKATQPSIESAPTVELPPRPIHDIAELLDIDYTDEEWNQLLIDYDEQLDRMRKIRGSNFPNSLAPAQQFDPRLPGNVYETNQSGVRLTENLSNLPEDADDIAFSPVCDLGHWIQTRQITSLELTEIYLKRIQEYGTKLECFITLTPDLARKQAREADEEIAAGKYRGPLHGLPYGLKDLFDTNGVYTTWGAGPYRDQVPETDAHVVKKLREAGAVLLGKTSCGALAYGDIWFGGVTRNPWDTREGSSGSSAGSAAATAAGLVAFSIGTETLGSIISPSVRCGVTGLRPTYGRVGRTGAMTLCWSLDKIGAICRSVEDTALVLDAINGIDPLDPGSIDTQFAYDAEQDLSELRVGYDPGFFTESEGHATSRLALDAVKKSGVQLKEISLPKRDTQSLMLQLWVEATSAFEELTLSNDDDKLRWQDNRAWPNTFRMARLIPAVEYIQVDRLRRTLMHDMRHIFDEVDVVLGDNFAGGMLQVSNFTGHPQLTLPCSFEKRAIKPAFEETGVGEGETANFPASMGLWGSLFGESKLLCVGRALEKQLNAISKRPPI